ncbi:low molecular weight protein arginine phosphatase [bacterium LRH843]|nr:low molecular weight protein arginine phosphatase [bacterium LRH843]
MPRKKVLFVCTGNTCRSPMAEALFRSRVKDEVEVKSAGVQAFSNSPASEGTQTVLDERNIWHSHTSQVLSEDLLKWADVVLTMTKGHKDMIYLLYPESCEHVYTLKEFVNPNSQDTDIADPIGGPIEAYRETAEQIDGCLDGIIRNLGER